jgi:hypothetical protein
MQGRDAAQGFSDRQPFPGMLDGWNVTVRIELHNVRSQQWT